MTPAPGQSFDVRFEDLRVLLNKARDDVQAGRAVRLGSLEKDVALLCREVMNSGPEIAHRYKMPISDLISLLDELAADITQYTDTLKGKN